MTNQTLRLTPTQRFYLQAMQRQGRLRRGTGFRSALTIRVLAERGLATVTWWGDYWEATITRKGREAIGLGRPA